MQACGEHWRSRSFGDPDSFPGGSNRIEQLGIQVIGVAVCFVWAFGLAFVALTVINRRFPLRIDREGELAGLNIAEHGASTEIADLLADIDEQRRSGDFARPVRVEPHTEVGRIATEYNRVLAAIAVAPTRCSCCVARPAAANESSSPEEALREALGEVCRFTRWPIGHAYLVGRDDHDVLVASGVWHLNDDPTTARSETRPWHDSTVGHGLPERALRTRHPVFVSLRRTGRSIHPMTVVVTCGLVGSRSPVGPWFRWRSCW